LLKDEVKKVLGRSLAIREVEVNSLSNPIYDLERFGIKIVASPRHAGLRLVSGSVTRNMEGALMKTYLAAPESSLVAAMDTRVISGGPFGSNHASGSYLDSILPVDVYIPGCPPNPRTVILGLLEVLGRL
jgi:Ni,Fe-hydrogenase III small subunit